MSNIDISKYHFLIPREGDTLQDNLMFFGIECGSGWYRLLNDLFREIEIHLKDNPELDFKFIQIKEKYGTLRLYFEGADIYIDSLCIQAEQLSETICEECGKEGKNIDDNGRYRTLCQDCILEHDKQQNV